MSLVRSAKSYKGVSPLADEPVSLNCWYTCVMACTPASKAVTGKMAIL